MASSPAMVRVKGTARDSSSRRFGDVLVMQELASPRVCSVTQAEVSSEGPKQLRRRGKHPHGHDPSRFTQQPHAHAPAVGRAMPRQRRRASPNQLHPCRADVQDAQQVVGMGFRQPNAQHFSRCRLLRTQQGAEQHSAQGKTTHSIQDFVGAHFDVALPKVPSSQGQERPRGQPWRHQEQGGEQRQPNEVGRHKTPRGAPFIAAEGVVVRDVIDCAMRQPRAKNKVPDNTQVKAASVGIHGPSTAQSTTRLGANQRWLK